MGLIQRDYVSVNHICCAVVFYFICCTQHMRVLVFILRRVGIILMGSSII
jgi:hypothetical protein